MQSEAEKRGQDELKFAIIFATKAHRDQTDKMGTPYIVHVMSVMSDPSLKNNDERIVAVLHDVVEDTPRELEDIRQHFRLHIAEAVKAITKHKDESYEEYLERVKQNPLALTVKKVDVNENLGKNPFMPDDQERDRLREKYRKALRILSS